MIKSLDALAPKGTGTNKAKSNLINSLQLSMPHTPGVILPFNKLREMINEQQKLAEDQEDE